jgi:1-acyl-sn-glycerol-3-phosphate acyltransferase
MSALQIFFSFVLRNRRVDNFMIYFWGRATNWLFGVRVKVSGLENIPEGKGCLFLFSHTSFFDIFALSQSIPGIRFGGKEELFRIPIFGSVLRSVGMLEIARDRREEVFKVYEAAQKRFEHGERFALAPEGTRQDTELLGPFKSGPFIFAINAQVDIVPIVIQGAARILPKGSTLANKDCWSSDVSVQVLPAVSTVGFNRENKAILMEQVFSKMKKALGQT